jgi:hypothetical protein
MEEGTRYNLSGHFWTLREKFKNILFFSENKSYLTCSKQEIGKCIETTWPNITQKTEIMCNYNHNNTNNKIGRIIKIVTCQ